MTRGRFGGFGGQYIPETLMHEVTRLEAEYERCKLDPEFNAELDALLRDYA
ncbi:MAG: tryptophan synthase subunit beta, partial [Oscillospiraceae bacterium]|nr:tryptophan synthase subunit beta [Oscillospiraceae bacterium]